MAKLTYAQQLAHPNWQRRRLHMLEAADWKCEVCMDSDTQLHVHHRQYFKGRMAWEYEDHELAVLCENCHEVEHAEDTNLKRLLSLVPLGHNPTFLSTALLAGFFGTDVQAVVTFAESVGVYSRFEKIGYIAAAMREVPQERLGEVMKLVQAIIREEVGNGSR
jgi:hypothetical protein